MKKLLFIILSVFVAFSCSKEDVNVVAEEPQPLRFVFNIASKPSFDADTKAVKTSWADGDKIYIVFDDVVPESIDDFLILKYSASANEWLVDNEGTTTPNAEGGTLDALYYENPDPDWYYTTTDDGAKFCFENAARKYGKYLFLTARNVPYTVEEGAVTSSLSLDFFENNVRTYVQFCITGIDGDWSFFSEDLAASNNSLANWSPVWGPRNKFFNYDSAYNLLAWQMNEREDGQYLYLSVKQNAEKFTVTLQKNSGENAGIYQKTFSKKISGKCAAITFKGPQFDGIGAVTNGWTCLTSGSQNGYAYVDLGGDVLWATKDVGAVSFDDYGDYFAWGEVEPYYSVFAPLTWKEDKASGYSYDSYKYWEWTDKENGIGQFLKYTNEAGETLESSDDAASVNWGGNWRTPTTTDWKWLRDNCTWTALTGMDGYKVTSNISGYEDRFIIFPVSGYFIGLELKYDCFYWAATSSNNGSSNVVAMSSSGIVFNNGPRCWGLPVRPVLEK